MTPADTLKRLRALERKIDKLSSLANLEAVLPLQLNQADGAGSVLSMVEQDRPIIAHTSLDFTIPAIASTVDVSITQAVDTSIWMVLGQTILIQDIDDLVRLYGQITEIIDATTFTLRMGFLTVGSIGDTVLTGANVIISGRPDVGLCLTKGPITARSGSTLGTGTVFLMEIQDDGTLHSTGQTVTVYNACGAIDNNWLCDLEREPFSGKLLAVAKCVYALCLCDNTCYQFSMPSLTGVGPCPDCTLMAIDSPWRLTFEGGVTLDGYCWYRTSAMETSVRGQPPYYWTVFVPRSTSQTLTFYESNVDEFGESSYLVIQYVRAGTLDCNSSMVLTRVGPADPSGATAILCCTGWPATITVSPCGSGSGSGNSAPPEVYFSDTTTCPVATLTVTGTGFDLTPGNNTITLNLGATATCTAVASSSSMTITFGQLPTSIGALTCIVANSHGSSAPAVEIADWTGPVVTLSTANLNIASATVTVNGYGFSTTPSHNTGVFTNGAAGTCTTATTTQLVFTFSAQPVANGPLKLTVTNTDTGCTSLVAVTVANITGGAAGEVWHDTFTDTNGVTAQAHTPDTSPGGAGYTAVYGTFTIQSNKLEPTTLAGSLATIRFNPGLIVETSTFDYRFTANATSFIVRLRSPSGGSGISVSVSRVSGDSWTVAVNDNAGNVDSQSVTLLAATDYSLVIVDNGTSVAATINSVTATVTTSEYAGQTAFDLETNASAVSAFLIDHLHIYG